jgi:hypothetical protein
MKGIHGVPYHVIFSVVILVLLLILTVGYVYGKTDIPFEKLWEQGPESGVPTNPNQIPNTGDYTTGGVDPAPHIFTTGSSWDFSEIACTIADSIFNDYTSYADNGPHNLGELDGFDYLHSEPSNLDSEYLINLGIFNYTEVASNSQVYETAISAHHGCHLCTYLPPDSTNTIPVGATGIQKLDEGCLNLQFRDRKIGGGSDPFCSKTVATSQGWSGKFSDNNFNFNDNNFVNSPVGWDRLFCQPFCDDNGQDKIRWFSEPSDQDNGRYAYAWNLSSSLKDREENSQPLTNGRQYIYGVFWDNGIKGYDVVFLEVPTNTFLINTEWNMIWDSLTAKGSESSSIYRRMGLGHKYWQARVTADFTIVPTQTLTVNDIRTKILSNDIYGGSTDYTKVPLYQCTGLTDCIVGVQQVSPAQCSNPYGLPHSIVEDFEKQPIQIYVDANDASNTPITDGTQDLPPGKAYRVIIKSWWQDYNGLYYGLPQDCFGWYDRSIAIMQLSKCSDVAGGVCEAPAICGGTNIGPMEDCTLPDICCAT